MRLETARGQELAIADLLDRALTKGVVLWGDVVISLAGVDLIYVSLKALVASVDTVERMRRCDSAGAMAGGAEQV